MTVDEAVEEGARATKALIESFIRDEIKELENSKKDYLNYMHVKEKEEDWHGVADCSADLRDIDAAIEALGIS